ncbi:MAG: carboxypeptidase-like regulatory domain-containing protein, partial [Elusimicrobiales bacterium]
MRRILGNLVAAVLVSVPFNFASAVPPATAPLTVTARGPQGQLMPGAHIAAINFGMNGPSTYTVIGQTGADGNVTLNLVVGMGYDIMYSSHGFSPTTQDQFNSPDPGVRRNFYPMDTTAIYSTVTFTAALTDVGSVALSFINATPGKVLFGGVNDNRLREPSAFGVVEVNTDLDADGTLDDGTLVVDNVPYAPANTYNIGLYDSEKNKGVGRSVMTALSSTTPTVSYTGVSGVDFDESMAPPRVENTASNNNDGGTNSSVQGVVRSTETANWTAIPYNGISFQSCRGGNWAQVDENGAFQLYNLMAGVTYYVEAYGGCANTPQGPGACFEAYKSPALSGGVQDLCSGSAAKGMNDFVYSSATTSVAIKLNRVARSTGTIQVCIQSASGVPIPNGNVNLNPDGSGWSNNNCVGTQSPGGPGGSTIDSKPGMANANVNVSADGCAVLDGLPSGNYMLNVWTPFTQNTSNSGPSSFNGGPDGVFSWNYMEAHCSSGTADTWSDDYRISVDTMSPTSLKMYQYGALLPVSSITVTVAISTTNTGVVRGVLKFPTIVDLSAAPIMITLQPQCDMGGCRGQGNFYAANGSGSSEYAYSIPVASAAAYYMNVAANGWGRVNMGGGNNQINLTASTFSVVNMSFMPAGTVSGTVYKPDGSVLTPGNNEWVYVNINSNSGWTNAQVQKDGTFVMRDVLPGINRISVQGGGMSGFGYTLPAPAPQVTVVAGSTAAINLNLVNATYINTGLDLTKIPDNSVIAQGYNYLLGYKVITMPSGSALNSATITKLINGGGDDQDQIRYSSPTAQGQEGPCGGGNAWPGGFCAGRVPSPAVYDLYMMHSGNFDDSGKSSAAAVSPGGLRTASRFNIRRLFSASAVAPQDMPYPHFTLISSSKNVIVDSAHAKTVMRTPYDSPMSTPSAGVLVDMTPAADQHERGNTKLFGSVTASNFFRLADYIGTGGDFNKFTDYLPIVILYDANGLFAAAGIVIPSPAYIAAHDKTNDFDRDYAAGYDAFKALLDGGSPYSYEIRSLAPNTCYTEVITTPNYPSYQTIACTGAKGTAKQIDVNLDTAVGAGATIQGVVRTTAAVATPLANVSVEVSGEGLETKSAVTDPDGLYKFEGLPPGEVKVKLTAEGYAPEDAEVELSGTKIVTLVSSMTAASGSITGTVYSQKLPFAKVQPGAEIYAYDEQYSHDNPTLPLPLLKTLTGSDGSYKLTGLVNTHTYRVFLKVPGKYTLNQTTAATNGVVSGVDFTMLAKPLDIEIFARNGQTTYEFTMLNPKDFKDGFAKWSEYPYNSATAATLTLNQELSGIMRGYIPVAGNILAGHTYVLHAEAVSYSNKTVVKELLFGLDYKGNAQQAIDGVIIGDDSDNGKGGKNNEAGIDQSGGDPSALVVPPGVITPISTAAVPSCTFKGEDKNSTDPALAAKVDALGKDAFAGNIYTLAISSVAINEDKGFDVTLAYDKSNSSLSDLGVASYDTATNKWSPLDAVATVNPIKGTVKVKLKK